MDAFFKLEHGDIKLNDGVALNIPIVKKIIKRDRGGVIPGDNDGRKKLLAIKELCFVWFIVNINSPSIQAGLSGKDLREDAKHKLELPDKWYPDELVKEFAEYYSNYHDGIVVKTIKQILKGFNNIFDTNDVLLKFIKESLKNKELNTDQIAELSKAQKELLNSASTITKLTKDLNDAMYEYRSIEESFGEMLGGNKITSSMIPD